MEEHLKTSVEGNWRLGQAKKRLDRWTAEEGERIFARQGLDEEGNTVEDDADDAGGAGDAAGSGLLPDADDAANVDTPLHSPADADIDIGDQEDQEMDMMSDPSGPAEVLTTKGIGAAHHGTVRVDARDDDMHEIMQLNLDERTKQSLCRSAEHAINIVRRLGGNADDYRRQRAAKARRTVSEIYSPPRVTRTAKMMPEYGILPGFALDLTTYNKDGVAWGFTKNEHRNEARKKVHTEEPMFIIGSPPCTDVSPWQNLNAERYEWSDAEIRRRRIRAAVHLEFMCELYQYQTEQGRYFLHGHPDGALSWDFRCVRDVLRRPEVLRVTGDQCQYGQEDGNGRPVRKRTGWMTNSNGLAHALNRVQRHGWGCNAKMQHIVLVLATPSATCSHRSCHPAQAGSPNRNWARHADLRLLSRIRHQWCTSKTAAYS